MATYLGRAAQSFKAVAAGLTVVHVAFDLAAGGSIQFVVKILRQFLEQCQAVRIVVVTVRFHR
jgi:hypothetical protein